MAKTEQEQGPEYVSGQRAARSPSSTPLGAWVRKTRFEHRLSQTELAARAGLSRSYLCNIERGHDIHPSVRTLDSLAAALGVGRFEILAAAGILEPAPGTRENEIEERFLTLFRNLNWEDQSSVVRFARFLQAEERRWNQPRLITELADVGGASNRQSDPTLFDVNAMTPSGADSGNPED